ncbi:rh5-interacting protein-like [Leptopilina boulardi]|uniref:rh5-interacting protein-like n=1 Tax=Leptopilina boulardi TaxID=63433 RepID=UPI0021F63459|nr:rh5-interacting protein-like [Leptopilina boulardi]
MSPIFTFTLLLAIAGVLPQKPNDEHQCGPNELFNECGISRNCHNTCLILNNSNCLNDTECHPGCECKFGYVRDLKFNMCILPEECPIQRPQQLNDQYQCGPNEVFDECGISNCESTCQIIEKNCVNNIGCRPGCGCKFDYVRDLESNSCVLPEQCPIERPEQLNDQYQCGPNEVFNECIISDSQRTCQITENYGIYEIGCHPGCECKFEYVRDLESNSCVLPEKCPIERPEQLNDQYQCGPNEVFNECIISDSQRTCQITENYGIYEIGCRPGCECKFEYVRDLESNSCVLPEKCPKQSIQQREKRSKKLFRRREWPLLWNSLPKC